MYCIRCGTPSQFSCFETAVNGLPSLFRVLQTLGSRDDGEMSIVLVTWYFQLDMVLSITRPDIQILQTWLDCMRIIGHWWVEMCRIMGNEDGEAKNYRRLIRKRLCLKKKSWRFFFCMHVRSIQNRVLFPESFGRGWQKVWSLDAAAYAQFNIHIKWTHRAGLGGVQHLCRIQWGWWNRKEEVGNIRFALA